MFCTAQAIEPAQLQRSVSQACSAQLHTCRAPLRRRAGHAERRRAPHNLVQGATCRPVCMSSMSLGDGDGETDPGIKPGMRVKVKKAITVWHVPKLKEGLNLEGLEGEVMDQIIEYQGKQLSANLPYKVQFMVPADDKEVKVTAHLAASELEAQS